MADQTIPKPAEFTCSGAVTSAAQTRALGARAAKRLRGGEVLLLYGPLGAGKTCFVQGLCQALGVAEEVTSPTFTLVNSYPGSPVIHHIDLYRIAPGADLTDIGLDELLDEVATGRAVAVAEWPQPMLALVPRRLELLVLPGAGADERSWYLRGVPELPAAWLDLLVHAGEPSC